MKENILIKNVIGGKMKRPKTDLARWRTAGDLNQF